MLPTARGKIIVKQVYRCDYTYMTFFIWENNHYHLINLRCHLVKFAGLKKIKNIHLRNICNICFPITKFLSDTKGYKMASWTSMGLFPDTQNCMLRIRRESRELFRRHRLQRKPLVSDAGMHQGTWCMSWSPTRGGGENVPGIPGAGATLNFTYLSRGPW